MTALIVNDALLISLCYSDERVRFRLTPPSAPAASPNLQAGPAGRNLSNHRRGSVAVCGDDVERVFHFQINFREAVAPLRHTPVLFRSLA